MMTCRSNDPVPRGRRVPRAARTASPRAITRRRRQRARGAALPIVLLISSMMLVTSAAWFEASLAASRGAANL